MSSESEEDYNFSGSESTESSIPSEDSALDMEEKAINFDNHQNDIRGSSEEPKVEEISSTHQRGTKRKNDVIQHDRALPKTAVVLKNNGVIDLTNSSETKSDEEDQITIMPKKRRTESGKKSGVIEVNSASYPQEYSKFNSKKTMPSSTKPGVIVKPLGIINDTNTCYCNAVVQSLTNDSKFMDLIQKCKTDSQGVWNMPCSSALLHLRNNRNQYQNHPSKQLSSTEIRLNTTSVVAEFNDPTVQQDAHEFMVGLLNTIWSESISEDRPASKRYFQYKILKTATCTKCQHKRMLAEDLETCLVLPLAQENTSRQMECFRGRVKRASRGRVRGASRGRGRRATRGRARKICRGTSRKGNRGRVGRVPAGPVRNIADLIRVCLAPEVLEVNCPKCVEAHAILTSSQRSVPKLNPGYASVTSTLSQVPQCLVINLARFDSEQFRVKEKIDILSDLDISEFVSPGNGIKKPKERDEANTGAGPANRAQDIESLEETGNVTTNLSPKNAAAKPADSSYSYKLRAVIHHDGTDAQSGHYFADVRLSDGSWINCDDIDISESWDVAENGLKKNTSGYILWYCRE